MLGTTWLPLTARTCLSRDVATAPKSSHDGESALGIFDGRTDEHHVRSIGEMRHECLGQGEWTEVVRSECRIPALGILRGTHLEEAGIVDEAHDVKLEREDFRRRTPNTRDVRQVAGSRSALHSDATSSGSINIGASANHSSGTSAHGRRPRRSFVEVPRCRGASDALSSSMDIGSFLFELKVAADDANLMFDLDQDGEVIGVDQNVSGIFKCGE
jgi:hypothetical protein